MRFAPLAALVFLSLAACKQAPDAPSADGTDNPDAMVGVEVPPGAGGPNGGLIEGVNPGFLGATAPEAAYDLGDGSVCYIYAGYVVRVSPMGEAGEEGEPRGDRVHVIARSEGEAPRAQCESEAARMVSTEGEADTFSGVEGDVLLLDRASGEAGRHLVAIDLASGGAPFLDAAYEDESVEIEDGVVRFGMLERRAEAPRDLAGVECPQGADFFESGLAVGVVRVSELDIESRERNQTDERFCIPLD